MSSTLCRRCLCTDTGTHQGSLQPQSYCAHQCLAPARRAEGVGLGSQHAGVGTQLRPGSFEATLQVSQGNERSDLATAAPLRRSARVLAGTCRHRARLTTSAPPSAPSGDPAQKGRSGRSSGDPASARRLFADARGPSAPGSLPPRAPPLAAKNFPWSLGGLGSRVLPRPPAGSPALGSSRRSAFGPRGRAFGRGELELGHLGGMSSGTLRRKPQPATS